MTETPHEISSRLSPLRDKIINPATRGLRPRFARNYRLFHDVVTCVVNHDVSIVYTACLHQAMTSLSILPAESDVAYPEKKKKKKKKEKEETKRNKQTVNR